MNGEHFRRCEELFHAAVSLPEAERERFLGQQCAGDAELRARVDRLLAAHARAGDFISSPAVAARTLTGIPYPMQKVLNGGCRLEVRAPLLDHEVLQFALSLPDEYVLSDGKGKTLLRALLGRYVPATMFDRPKQGFSLPLAPWFRRELRPRALALGDGPLVETGFFRREGIRALVEEHDLVAQAAGGAIARKSSTVASDGTASDATSRTPPTSPISPIRPVASRT